MILDAIVNIIGTFGLNLYDHWITQRVFTLVFADDWNKFYTSYKNYEKISGYMYDLDLLTISQ